MATTISFLGVTMVYSLNEVCATTYMYMCTYDSGA